MKTFEDFIEDYYRGTGEKVQARTKKWMDKKGQKGAPGLDAMKARTAEHEAKRGVKEENALEKRAKENEKARKWLKKDAKDSGYTDIALKASMSKGAGVKEEVVTERTGSRSITGDMNSRFWSGDKNTNITNNVTQGGQGAAAALGAIGGAAALHYGKKAAKSIGKSVKKTTDKIKSKFKKEEYSSWRSEIDEGLTAGAIGTAAALGVVGGAASALGNMSTRSVAKKLSKKKRGAGVKEEVVSELNRYGKETGKATGSLNKRAGTPIKKGGGSDRALNFVRNKIRQETGKPEGQQKKVKGEKGRVQYGDRKVSPSTTIAKRRQAAKDADAAMRDTRGT